MEKYRKLVVALIGAAAIIASSFGLTNLTDASDEAIAVVNSVVALLTALGVRQVPNDQGVSDGTSGQ